MLSEKPFDAASLGLPPSLKATRHGAVAVLTLARSEKRNSLNDEAVIGIETFFTSLPDDARGQREAATGSEVAHGGADGEGRGGGRGLLKWVPDGARAARLALSGAGRR